MLFLEMYTEWSIVWSYIERMPLEAKIFENVSNFKSATFVGTKSRYVAALSPSNIRVSHSSPTLFNYEQTVT